MKPSYFAGIGLEEVFTEGNREYCFRKILKQDIEYPELEYEIILYRKDSDGWKEFEPPPYWFREEFELVDGSRNNDG